MSAEERRLVTILFSDVAGSTALGEELDPEDLRALLARYYAIAKDVVAEHGGTLEKFIGDAVMAVFGLPTAHGDDAVRAIAAAEQLRDRVRGDPKLGDHLPIRIGLNTGEVVATRDAGSGDFLVTGDAVNTAARLQQLAEPWAIMCGDRTASAAARQYTFGPAVELTAKGKRAPLRALPLGGRRAAGQRVRMPLFGRDGDLAQLELAAGRVLDDKRPFLVSVIAPAGTGKSRLLEEFLDRLEQRAPDARVAIAQCLPYGQRLTYWPLRAVLHRLVGAAEDASPAEVRDTIARWLAANDVPDRDQIAPLLAATVGAGEQEVLDRAALFAAWRTCIETAARAHPLVVVFEDLHWSSDSLLDLVEFVMQPRGATPVLMIALTRPELLDRRTSWGGGRRNHLALSLEPLRDGAVAQLVEHLLESRQPEVVERIVARAEGNPFYAGELVRTFMERGGSLDALPDTVQATVLARLDGLTEDERRLVQIGAVFGRAFRANGVEAIAPELAGRAADLCEALIDKDLVRPSGADSFVFRHILIREVAYQTLPRAIRTTLHAAAARWIEMSAAGREETVAELIAFHYREAASLVSAATADDPAAVAIRRDAVRWLVRAADAALASAANTEAARHLRAAIELAEPGELVALHERLGDAFADAGQSIASYKIALDLTDETVDPDRALRLIGGILVGLTRSAGAVADRPTGAVMDELRTRGAALLGRTAEPRATARFHVAEGFHAFWVAGDRVPTEAEIAGSERHAATGLEIARAIDNVGLQSGALDGLSANAMQRGNWTAARETSRSRLTLGDRLDLAEKMDTYSVIAWASIALGDLDEAVRISREGLGLIQPGQVPAWALHLVAWRLYGLALRGDWDESIGLADRARELWIETGRISAGYALRGFIAARDVAAARRQEGLVERLDDAIFGIVDQFAPSPATTAQVDALRSKPGAVVEMLRIAVTRRRNPEGFERLVSAAVDRDEPMPADAILAAREAYRPSAVQHVLVALDRALAVAKRDAVGLGAVLARYEAMGARPLVGRVRCELGRLTGDDAQIEAGLRILRELGDQPQLEKFER
ncbi:MAG TPA: adenylate/guanylate cyclase domain-containing protein [Candidatus Limnocylindria bacterium]|nr:adenylate/guanylate cyclase domain-containing protein [Candidatus Limnocylindria bacterium]